MSKLPVFASFIGILALALATAALGEAAPKNVVDLANGELLKLGSDPILVAAVKHENAKEKTLAQIKARDAEWSTSTAIDERMSALMNSACGKQLKQIVLSKPYFSEIFVVDNQGANVCMTQKTSDYWQGDEDKFQKSFNSSAGTVFVDEVEFDQSSQSYSVHVSVPVRDENKVIGVAVFGIDVDRLG